MLFSSPKSRFFRRFLPLEIPVHAPILARNNALSHGLFSALHTESALPFEELEMNVKRYEPWSIFDLMQRELSPYVGRQTTLKDDSSTVADWVPAVNIVEESDKFVLTADVPGVDPAKIEVSMDAGVLSVSGERYSETSDKSDGLSRIERISGKFYRRFSLPETADADGIAAKSSNGILEVTIPKQPEIQARRITVEAA